MKLLLLKKKLDTCLRNSTEKRSKLEAKKLQHQQELDIIKDLKVKRDDLANSRKEHWRVNSEKRNYCNKL